MANGIIIGLFPDQSVISSCDILDCMEYAMAGRFVPEEFSGTIGKKEFFNRLRKFARKYNLDGLDDETCYSMTEQYSFEECLNAGYRGSNNIPMYISDYCYFMNYTGEPVIITDDTGLKLELPTYECGFLFENEYCDEVKVPGNGFVISEGSVITKPAVETEDQTPVDEEEISITASIEHPIEETVPVEQKSEDPISIVDVEEKVTENKSVLQELVDAVENSQSENGEKVSGESAAGADPQSFEKLLQAIKDGLK